MVGSNHLKQELFAHSHGLDNIQWASFISDLHSKLKKISGSLQALQLVLLAMFGAVYEPLAPCMMVYYWVFMFFIWQLVCKFGIVERNFLWISCHCLCFCTLPKFCLSFFLLWVPLLVSVFGIYCSSNGLKISTLSSDLILWETKLFSWLR